MIILNLKPEVDKEKRRTQTMPTKSGKAGLGETEEVARILFVQFCKDRFKAEGIEDIPHGEESVEIEEYFQKE